MSGDKVLTRAAFFAGESRFSSSPEEGRIAELEGLQNFLKEGVAAIDSRTSALAAPTERLRKLLTAKDKKATINEMAGKTPTRSV